MADAASDPAREALLRAVADALEGQPRILAAILFGSHARGRARPDSDIDVAVLLDPPPKPDESGTLQRELTEALGARVAADRLDLVLLDRAPPALAFQVLKHGSVALCRDPVALHRFKVTVYGEHADFEPVERLFRGVTRERAMRGTSRG